MPARIDHVIAAAEELGELERAFRRLGFWVTGGGVHPRLGTRNRVIILGQGYIELLAVLDPEKVSPVVRQRVESSPGWIGYALQSAEIHQEAEALRARGVDIRGPHAGRLVRPDGMERGWQTATIGGGDLFASAEPLPFLIQHNTVGPEHQVELAGERGVGPHANGAQRIVAVAIAVRDLDAAVLRFGKALGLTALATRMRDDTLGADVVPLGLNEGNEAVALAQPAGEGVARDRLDAAGEGICRVDVGVPDLAATQKYLSGQAVATDMVGDRLVVSRADTHGATLVFVPA